VQKQSTETWLLFFVPLLLSKWIWPFQFVTVALQRSLYYFVQQAAVLLLLFEVLHCCTWCVT